MQYAAIINAKSNHKIGITLTMVNYTTIEYIYCYVSQGDQIAIVSIPIDTDIYCLTYNTFQSIVYIQKIMPLWCIYTTKYLVSLGANIHIALWNTFKYDIIQYLLSLGAKYEIGSDMSHRYKTLIETSHSTTSSSSSSPCCTCSIWIESNFPQRDKYDYTKLIDVYTLAKCHKFMLLRNVNSLLRRFSFLFDYIIFFTLCSLIYRSAYSPAYSSTIFSYRNCLPS